MDLKDQLANLASQAEQHIKNETLQTEEATKMALVAPFIQILGYNIFDPTEVIPEFSAELPGTKRGEKVDYAIKNDEQITILFECKNQKADLNLAHRSQLHRYFHATSARIGILTNGVQYWFFSDLEKDHVMDETPFLIIDLLNLDQNVIPELQKLTKSSFDIETMLPVARELKYTRQIKRILSNEFKYPSEEFVKYFAKQVYQGKLTQKWVDYFTDTFKRAFRDFINEQISERLQSVIDNSNETQPSQPNKNTNQENNNISKNYEIATTDEELKGLEIVKQILANLIDKNRISYKDTKSYFNILLDNHKLQQICRLYFNYKSIKRLGLFDKEEEYKVEISSVDDIKNYERQLKQAVKKYLNKG